MCIVYFWFKMQESMTPAGLLRQIVQKGQKLVYSEQQREADKKAVVNEVKTIPKNSRSYIKAKLLQATRDMRSLKLNVRRLTQTEIVPGEVKGRLNESLVESMSQG